MTSVYQRFFAQFKAERTQTPSLGGPHKEDILGYRVSVGDIVAWPASGYWSGQRLLVGTIREITKGALEREAPKVIAVTTKGKQVDLTWKDVALVGNEATTF